MLSGIRYHRVSDMASRALEVSVRTADSSKGRTSFLELDKEPLFFAGCCLETTLSSLL